AESRELGAWFAKWRATYFVGDGTPSDFAVLANGHAMARYAALCQEAGIVPIVEPETLMDGDHDLAGCEAATGEGLQRPVRRAPGPPRRPTRHAAQGEHGRPGQGRGDPGRRRHDRGGHP